MSSSTPLPPTLRLRFRDVGPTDLATCVALEAASYPGNEAASKSTLQYRQHQAATFFRCAVLEETTETGDHHHHGSGGGGGGGGCGDDEESTVVGFVCSTRCRSLTHESMTTHVVGAPLLAIHSVVVRHDFRRQGIGSAMLKEYIRHVQEYNMECAQDAIRASSPIEKIVLLAKEHLLTFYMGAGFKVMRPSPIVHGGDLWYELEQPVSIPWNWPCWIVDAFADPKQRRTGNPASIVRVPDDVNMDDPAVVRWMQTTAQEFNLAETAFVWKYKPPPPIPKEDDSSLSDDDLLDDHDYTSITDVVRPAAVEETPTGLTKEDDETEQNPWQYSIRYFTPTVEVPLCGHATLAAAAILFQHDGVPESATVVLHAPEDVLTASLASTSSNPKRGHRRISMIFPSKPATALVTPHERTQAYAMMKDAFGIDQESILWVGVSTEIGDLLVELTTDAFESLGSNGGIVYDALLRCNLYTRGVIVSCRPRDPVTTNSDSSKDNTTNNSTDSKSGGKNHDCGAATNGSSDSTKSKVDFYSRFFAPKAGILEDIVTGSAHCVLAPYYCPLLKKKQVTGYQKSSHRGGIVKCTMVEEHPAVKRSTTIPKVQLVGLAVTTMSGRIQ